MSWHCLSLGLEWKLTFSSPVTTAEFSKFASLKTWFYLAVLGFSCNTRGLPLSLGHAESLAAALKFLVAACGIYFPDQGPGPPAVGERTPSPSTTREVPEDTIFDYFIVWMSLIWGDLCCFPYYVNLNNVSVNVLKPICLCTSHIISLRNFLIVGALQEGMGHCVIQGVSCSWSCARGFWQTTVWRFGTGDLGRGKRDIISGSSSHSWDWRKNASQISLLPFLEDDAWTLEEGGCARARHDFINIRVLGPLNLIGYPEHHNLHRKRDNQGAEQKPGLN